MDIYKPAVCHEQSHFPPEVISALLLFALLAVQVKLWHLILLFCISGPGVEPIIEITHNITAFLGEDVYLGCRYLGESEIQSADWKFKSKIKYKRLAGFVYGKVFNRDGFSEPDSLTNLTVKMNVSSVEVEGEYICEFSFEDEDEDCHDSTFLTVVGKPSQ